MNRARFGAIGVIAALSSALLFSGGCSVVDGVKEGVAEASNTVEVCTATIALYNKHITALQAASTKLAAAPADPEALNAFNGTAKTEMSTLHTGLQEQLGKAKDAEVKTAIEKLDEQVAIVAEKPESIATTGGTLDERVADMNKACNATAPAEKPAK